MRRKRYEVFLDENYYFSMPNRIEAIREARASSYRNRGAQYYVYDTRAKRGEIQFYFINNGQITEVRRK